MTPYGEKSNAYGCQNFHRSVPSRFNPVGWSPRRRRIEGNVRGRRWPKQGVNIPCSEASHDGVQSVFHPSYTWQQESYRGENVAGVSSSASPGFSLRLTGRFHSKPVALSDASRGYWAGVDRFGPGSAVPARRGARM